MNTTIDLPDVLKRKAEQAARERGVSLDELIRDALESHLSKPEENDPLYTDEETYEGDVPEDLSVNHDRYLYGDTPS